MLGERQGANFISWALFTPLRKNRKGVFNGWAEFDRTSTILRPHFDNRPRRTVFSSPVFAYSLILGSSWFRAHRYVDQVPESLHCEP